MALGSKSDFPFFKSGIVYLDSAATSQKPKVVLDSLVFSYEKFNANVHRGVYALADKVTEMYELARLKVANFIGAKQNEVIFVRNATEALNVIALSFGSANVGSGDVILLTEMEHHSNIVPWQMLAKKVGAKIEFVPIREDGSLDVLKAKKLLLKKPKIFSFTHVSNVLGAINPAKELVKMAKDNGVFTVIDASQSVPHMAVDVRDIGCDFLVFSGHKLYGPHVGVLYGRFEHLDKMEPVFGGGDMIKSVSFEKSSWNEVPWKFEAGTPNVPGAIGLGSAVDYLQKIGMGRIFRHEKSLTKYALSKMKKNNNIKIYGPDDRVGVISFNFGDMHAHDVSSVLDDEGICVRSGNHCAEPLMGRLKIPACARISFGVYTSKDDIDRFVSALKTAEKVFRL